LAVSFSIPLFCEEWKKEKEEKKVYQHIYKWDYKKSKM